MRYDSELYQFGDQGGQESLMSLLPFERTSRQTGTTVMRQMTVVARMKLPSELAAPGIELGSRG